MTLPINIKGLVTHVRESTQNRPLDNLTAAVGAAAELEGLGDELITHFVLEARDAGLSWAQIGTSLGVTRQAARQRFVAPTSDPTAALVGSDGIRNKAAPFSAVRFDDGDLVVQIEIGGTWYRLAEIDDITADALLTAARDHFQKRWLKRISEDLDNVYEVMGQQLAETAEVVLVDAAGRRFNRTVDVTIAKRKAAWRYNNDHQ